jgi:hypothetical protein
MKKIFKFIVLGVVDVFAIAVAMLILIYERAQLHESKIQWWLNKK